MTLRDGGTSAGGFASNFFGNPNCFGEKSQMDPPVKGGLAQPELEPFDFKEKICGSPDRGKILSIFL
jgi:hypothetical protein